MKRPPQLRSFVLALVCTILARSHAVKTAADSASGSGSPVGKAVELLENLQSKVQKAANAEQMTYMKFEMWCQLEGQKSEASVNRNEEKVKEYSARLASAEVDMKSASMRLQELTSVESTDAEDLQAATELRKKENDAFVKLQAEIGSGLKATDNAMEKLMKQIAGGGQDGGAAFLQKKSLPVTAMKAFGDVMEELAQAEELAVEGDMSTYSALVQESARSAAARADARVDGELERLSSSNKGDVPVETLKENLQMLKDVKLKSSKSLANARRREARFQREFEKLRKALKGKMDAEAKDLKNTQNRLAEATAIEAEGEQKIAAAKADIEAAQEYMKKVGADCMDKAQQYQDQKKARKDEILAIRKALKELQRIMNLKSAQGLLQSSQTLSFLQLGTEESEKKERSNEALTLVRQRVDDLMMRSPSPSLTQLSSKIEALSRYGRNPDDIFGEIRKTIKEMVENLERKNSEEQNKKAFCENEKKHTEQTHADRKAAAAKNKATLNLAKAEIAALRQELAELAKELAEIAKTLRERGRMREDEHRAHVKAYKDMQEGQSGVQAALKALRDFYSQPQPKENTDMASNMANMASGKPPSLDTGAVAENAGAGVIGLLEVIEDSFAKNMATLKAEDEAAQETYDELVKESKMLTGQKEADQKRITTSATSLERRVTELMSDHASSQQQLEAIEEYMEKLKAECAVKVETREEIIAKRDRELSSLKEALAIIESER